MRSQMCVQLHSVMPFCWRVDDYGCNHITCERGGYQTASNNKIIIANIMYNNHSRTDHIVGLCGVHIVDWLRQPVMQWIRRIRVCYIFFLSPKRIPRHTYGNGVWAAAAMHANDKLPILYSEHIANLNRFIYFIRCECMLGCFKSITVHHFGVNLEYVMLNVIEMLCDRRNRCGEKSRIENRSIHFVHTKYLK